MPISPFNDITRSRNLRFRTGAKSLKLEAGVIPPPDTRISTRHLRGGGDLKTRFNIKTGAKRIIALMSNIGCGGAEIHSISLFNGLCEKGFEIKVLVLDTERIGLAGRLDEHIDKVFIKRRRYFDLSAFFQVKKQIKSYCPDVFIMVDSYPILYGRILKLFGFKVKSIIILHNTEAVSLKRELQNRLIYAPSVNKLDRIVFVSENQERYWIKRYKIDRNKASVILNGIALENYDNYLSANDKQNCRKKLGIPTDRIVIVMNASLWLHKNHDHMIKAISRLKNEGYNLFLLIVGDGPRRKALEDLVASKGLTEDVMFTGFVADVMPYLMSADFSALTSSETLSLAALESMALGKPLILSNSGGSPEIVDSGYNGILYKHGDIEELVNAIKKMIDQSAYCTIMSEKCREKAVRCFGFDRMLNQYIALINE